MTDRDTSVLGVGRGTAILKRKHSSGSKSRQQGNHNPENGRRVIE